MKEVATLPTVQYYQQQFPLPDKLRQRKLQYDKDILNSVNNKERFVIVVGPCSADNYHSMVDYLTRLKQLSDTVSDKILIVARIYTAKPRTDGGGYLGLLFNENQSDSIDFVNGIANCRKLMLKCLDIGLPIADELLYPFVLPYLSDLVSYYFLGARSSLDPLHRDYCSNLAVAVGVKNAIDGDLVAVTKSVKAIASSKTYVDNGNIVVSDGNSNCHVVLRGSHNGIDFVPNYDNSYTTELLQLYSKYNITNRFVMIDCSHANSSKIASRQVFNAMTVIDDNNVGGIVLESYLNSGVALCEYGVSKTDECLDWNTTKELILNIYGKLKNKAS